MTVAPTHCLIPLDIPLNSLQCPNIIFIISEAAWSTSGSFHHTLQTFLNSINSF